jgi:hypothetical protein
MIALPESSVQPPAVKRQVHPSLRPRNVLIQVPENRAADSESPSHHACRPAFAEQEAGHAVPLTTAPTSARRSLRTNTVGRADLLSFCQGVELSSEVQFFSFPTIVELAGLCWFFHSITSHCTCRKEGSLVSRDFAVQVSFQAIRIRHLHGAHACPLFVVQALEAKVQLLRRAVKIKEAESGGTQKPLDELVLKWRTAGRDIARDVWSVVKDGPKQDAGGWPAERGSGFNSSWGYDKDDAEGADAQTDGARERFQEHDMAKEKVEDDIGTMLRQLRIDPATLGWDDEEGDFVDV